MAIKAKKTVIKAKKTVIKAKKAKKPKESPEEKKKKRIKRNHMNCVRRTFLNTGFDRVSEIANKDIIWGKQAGEFDDAFIYENLIILAEYTTSQSSDTSSHLKKKKILFSNVLNDAKAFVAYLRAMFPDFDARLGAKFHPDNLIVRIIYCSVYDIDESTKQVVTEPIYLDFPQLKYFDKLASTIKVSTIPEMLDFLEVDPADVAKKGVFSKKKAIETYEGSILPESSSGFPAGYKVVSFYADAAALLGRAYVLRRDGWRGSYQAYQRMIQKKKIEAIRKKLKSDRQVFVNNLIATLPSDVHPVGKDDKTIEISELTNTQAVSINLPLRANSIGLIDGQHRLYSYYELKEDDPEIKHLRHQQNLLVTGIIYPPDTVKEDAERFEATLFLAINSNQTNAPPALRQEIEVILRPYSPTAIGKQIMQRLASAGPLSGYVETHAFDHGKLKSTSIVSYGLGPLIKLGGQDSLFRLFEHPQKDTIASEGSSEALAAYLQFATSKINAFLNAVKSDVGTERWTADRSVADRVITVTYINTFLIILRLIIENDMPTDFATLKAKLAGVGNFPFKEFRSSQYNRRAQEIFAAKFKPDGKKELAEDKSVPTELEPETTS
ncbi:DGQHR domain-containing protein [Phyllobacterium zundukense]|uniref:DGQHR domain-containing protein n=1 Tax=Phyllobacterium zundukense TaxID=1867719 RepID=A0A2N9VUU0_9HYPH|nr:DGQHR domain-containing protein [Phyllobacterium zundukense]ATU95288.1 hypothetical protein BLM14_26595 [Phyllobacterium zundukense]PIO43258.1 hypothetical protein B5P45_19490 [Phyllobacterium zundukense]